MGNEGQVVKETPPTVEQGPVAEVETYQLHVRLAPAMEGMISAMYLVITANFSCTP